MRKWLNGNKQKLALWVRQAVLVGLVAVFMVACVPVTPDPAMPEFEGTVLTDADIDKMVEWAELIEDAGGAQNSTILLVHDFQEVTAVLVGALDASSDGAEIPLLLDVFYAYSLSLQEAAANLTPPDSLVLFSALSEENDIFGGNLGRIKQALRDWIVTEHGACDNVEAKNVFVSVTPEETQEVAELLETTAEDLKGRLKSTPPIELLTEELRGELRKVIVKSTGKSYRAVSKSWLKAIRKGLKQGIKKAVSKAALLGKLGNLLLDYGEAISVCYWEHFPKWADIENCLVNKYGLEPELIRRIKNAILDP